MHPISERDSPVFGSTFNFELFRSIFERFFSRRSPLEIVSIALGLLFLRWVTVRRVCIHRQVVAECPSNLHLHGAAVFT